MEFLNLNAFLSYCINIIKESRKKNEIEGKDRREFIEELYKKGFNFYNSNQIYELIRDLINLNKKEKIEEINKLCKKEKYGGFLEYLLSKADFNL